MKELWVVAAAGAPLTVAAEACRDLPVALRWFAPTAPEGWRQPPAEVQLIDPHHTLGRGALGDLCRQRSPPALVLHWLPANGSLIGASPGLEQTAQQLGALATHEQLASVIEGLPGWQATALWGVRVVSAPTPGAEPPIDAGISGFLVAAGEAWLQRGVRVETHTIGSADAPALATRLAAWLREL